MTNNLFYERYYSNHLTAIPAINKPMLILMYMNGNNPPKNNNIPIRVVDMLLLIIAVDTPRSIVPKNTKINSTSISKGVSKLPVAC